MQIERVKEFPSVSIWVWAPGKVFVLGFGTSQH